MRKNPTHNLYNRALLVILFFTSILTAEAQNNCPEWQWAEQAGMKDMLENASTKAIATDANGNSYVAGVFSGAAYFGEIIIDGNLNFSQSFIAKIDSDGKWLWVKTVNGSRGNGANTLALDATGNIYISGYFYDTARFGNITLVAPLTQSKLYVAKLDNSGNWQWAAKADGGIAINSNSMAVDNNGNSYITGDFTSNSGNDVSFGNTKIASAGGRDIFLSKIDASGQWQWAVQAGGTSNDMGYGVALDASGNPYITGYFINTVKFGSTQLSSNTSNWNDAFISKLNTSGQWQWTVKAGGSRGVVGNGITIDGSGNVFVTGGFVNTATFGTTNLTSAGDDDMFVTKLNSNGQWQWAVKYGSTQEEIGYGIKADGTGNLFVMGNMYNSILLNKYNSNTGQLISAMKPNYTGTVRGFDLGAGDNAYFAGYNPYNPPLYNYLDLTIIKYNHKDQKESWKTTVGAIGYINDSKIIADKNGNTYITGYYSANLSFGNTVLASAGSQDMFIAKMDKQGKWLWAITAGGTSTDYGDAISVDDNGMIYIAGRYTGSATFGSTTLTASDIYKSESFLGKLNNNGQWIWAVKAGELVLSFSKNIPVDAAGNIYLAGRFSGTAKFGTHSVTSSGSQDLFVAKSNKDGAWQWAVNTAINQYSPIGIELDGSGNAYLAGSYTGTIKFGAISLSPKPNGINIFIAQLNNSGVWQSAISNSLSSYNPNSLIIDKSGNVYIKGMFSNTLTFGSLSLSTTENYTIYLAKLGSNGQWNWANKVERKFGGSGGLIQNSADLTIDASGNVYIFDIFNDNVTINGTKKTSSFYYNTFVAKYANNGTWLWLQNTGFHYPNFGRSLAADNAGGVYLTGTFQNELTFGNTKLKSFALPGGSYYQSTYIAKILDDKMTINAGNNTTITCGTSTKLNANGKMYTTVSWSPSTGLDNPNILTPNASPLKTTTYTINATNSCGHQATSQVTVTVNPAFQLNTNAEKTTINCGESTKLNANPSISGQMTYTWSPSEGLSNSNIADPVARPAYNTTYTVTAKSSNGCMATGSVTITVNNPNPPAVGLTTSTGEKYFCNSGLTLSAAPGFASYMWNTGATTQTIIPTQPGTYTVEIIDNNGCGNKDSITLTPLTKITAPDGPYLCAGQPNASVRLDAGAGFDSYEWSNGQQTQSLTVTTTGTYSVKVTKGSCQYTTSIQVMNHPGSTNAEFTYQSNGLRTQFTTLTQGVRFVDWNFGDGNNSSVLNPEHTFAQPGTYTVCLELTDFCGATDKKCKSITVNTPNGIEEINEAKENVKIYPNPATDLLVIEFEKITNSPIIITDITGRQVLKAVNPISNVITLDISVLSNGLYFINLNQENYKFIKQ